jgi:hypothetical protein
VAQVVVVAGGRGAFDVVDPLGEIIDAERHRGGEERRDAAEGIQHLERGAWQMEAELAERLHHLGALHVVAPAERGGDPGDDRADEHRGEAAGQPAGQADIGRPADQDDAEGDEGDPRQLPHLEGRAHRNEGDRDAG